MIKYEPKFWFKHIFTFHKSDTIIVMWKELIYMGLFTLGLAYLELNYITDKETLDMLGKLGDVFALIGFVLSLLLVFRTNSAYERWWEGRKKWGELINNCRNLAIKIDTMTADKSYQDFFSRMIPNYAFAMKEHLRLGVKVEELELTEEELEEINKKGHKTSYIAQKMYWKLNEMKKNKELSEEEFLSIDVNLKTFSDITGACERIKNTPIPYSYSSFLKKFIFVFVSTIPLSFVGSFGYFSALIAVFIFYVLVSMEILAEEIEDPFGIDENDLPTDELCHKIKDNVKEILEY
ncbi:MAG: bestrophin family protein [Flavobacteriales bacterium]